MKTAVKQLNKEDFLSGMSQRTLMFFSSSDISLIENKTIALAGLGGVGAIVLELLARMGVMKFRLMDMDKYELSNMNRQIFATQSTLDCWKVDVGISRVKEINPYAEIEMAFKEKANKANSEELIRGADMLIIETDFPSSKVLFHEFARKHQVPIINGHCVSVVGGVVKVFDYRDPKQVDGKRHFRTTILDKLAHILLGSGKSLDEMTWDDLEQLDKSKVPTASLNFVTNLVGCMVVAETVKFLTGMGKSCRYPKEIYVNLAKPKMGIRSSRSLKSPFLKLISKSMSEKFYVLNSVGV